jgi:hypothetical protein
MQYRSHQYLSRLGRSFYKAIRYVRCGNQRRFLDLLTRRPELLQHLEESFTLLTWLVWRRQYGLVQHILRMKADPDLVEAGSNTPLIHAAVENDVRMAGLLLDFGADIEKANDRLETPLGFACSYDAVEAVKLLCERGADVNGTEGWGWSYLYSVQSKTQGDAPDPRQIEIERLLIAHGAQLIETVPKLKS